MSENVLRYNKMSIKKKTGWISNQSTNEVKPIETVPRTNRGTYQSKNQS